MRFTKNSDPQHKKLLKYFAVPYVSIIAVIFLFNFLNYRSVTLTIENQTIQSTYSNLKVSSETLSTKLNEINDIITQLDYDQDLIQTAMSPKLDLLETKKLQKKLAAYTGAAPLIEDILLYFPRSGIAVTDSNSYYMDGKQNMIACGTLSFEEFQSNYLTTVYNRTFLTLPDFKYMTSDIQDTHCIISSLPVGEPAPIIQVLCLLQSEELQNIISGPGQNRIFLNIVDQDDRYLLEENPDFPAELFHDVDGYFIKKAAGQKRILFRIQAEHTPFHLVAAISYSDIMEAADRQRNGIYAILLFSVLAALALASYFTFRRARSVKTIMDTNEELASKIESNKPYIINEFLKGLVLNEITQPGEIDSIINELEIPLSNGGNYAVLLIWNEFNCPDGKQYARELYLRKFIIQNVITELAPSAISCEISFDNLCFILPFGQKTEPEYRMEIESIFDTIDNVLVQDVNYNLKYACGDVVDSLQKISASFFDAKNKLILEQTAEATGQNESGQEIYYPLELEASLINAVNTGSKQSIFSIFKLITEANQGLSDPSCLLGYLSGTLRRIVSEKKALIPDAILESFHYQLAAPEEYLNIFTQVCDYVSSNNSPLLTKIRQYIDENFSDTQLSRTNIAKQFHITEEYISVLFKKYDNSTFLNYVDKVRVQHAQILLQENPSMPLEQIAEKCGYSNIISFRRAFKKITNTVPSAFRKK